MLVIDPRRNHGGEEEPETVESLIALLAREPLDPRFERHGNFIAPALYGIMERVDGVTVYRDGPPIYPDAPDAVRIWGNFFNLSHVFCVDTDEPEIIKALTTAIRANQTSAAYLAAKD